MLRCSNCNAEIEGIAFTSQRTGFFLCAKCFAKEVARSPSKLEKLPEHVRKLISPYLSSMGIEPRPSYDIGDANNGHENEEGRLSLSWMNMNFESSRRASRPRRKVEKIYGVLYFRDLDKLDETIRRIVKYYDRKVENLPANAPRQVDMDVRYAGEGKKLWALVISAEVPVNGQDPAIFFSEFVEQLAGREPKDVGKMMPEKLKRMQLKRSHHIGHKRLSDFIPIDG